MKNITATFGTLGLLATMLVAPMAANASSNDRHAPRQSSNVRLDVSIGSAVLGLFGLGGHNAVAPCADPPYRIDVDRGDRDRIGNYAQRRDDRRDQSHRDDRGNQDGRGSKNARDGEGQNHGRR